jgi:N-acetyl-beta-hexosaminidase
MRATIPLAKCYVRLDGERFAPDWKSEVKLSSSALQDSRLTAAVVALFAGRELREEAPSDAWSYTLLWGGGTVGTESAEIPSSAFPSSIPFSSLALPAQGYCLTMRGSGASIRANDAAGLFYGLQTLRQLLDGLDSGDSIEAVSLADWPDVPLRCMNYDLRQTFSKPELLIDYVAKMASFKANALLIEYEDKFPFERKPQRAFRHPRHALTEDELERLLEAAERSFMEVIPLQQSFGHLEYILGREEYKHLRESEESTGELCPSRPEAFALVAGLLEEMAERHPRSRYLHLGCDEVYSLCECAVCREKFGGSRNLAFLDFVNRLVDFTCSLGKRPIIWQDILADCSDEELALLDPRVAVMIWHYNGKNIARFVSPLASRLQELGIEVMGAPAVRCFDRMDDQNYPLVRERLANIDQWTKAAADLRLAGLVGTNWTAVFSLGVPYGVFETTWYTMAYFADMSWGGMRNGGGRASGDGASSDRVNLGGTSGDGTTLSGLSGVGATLGWISGDETTLGWISEDGSSAGRTEVIPFIDRFLQVFHGIAPDTARELLGNHDDEDYYSSMPILLEAVRRNTDTARLIAALIDFEKAADRSRTIHKYAYRHRLYPDSEPEWRSLSNNYRITREGLRRSRERISEALRSFQPDDMAEHYILSRFYLHDYLEENLYRTIGWSEG